MSLLKNIFVIEWESYLPAGNNAIQSFAVTSSLMSHSTITWLSEPKVNSSLSNVRLDRVSGLQRARLESLLDLSWRVSLPTLGIPQLRLVGRDKSSTKLNSELVWKGTALAIV